MIFRLKQRIVHAYVRTIIFFDFFGRWHRNIMAYTYKGITFYVRPKTSDKLVIREVLKNKTYAHPKIKLTKKSTVLDIGANIGAFSLAVAKQVKEVYAVEALLQNYLILRKNIATNKAKNVTTENVALVNKKRKVTFFAGNNNLGGSSMYEKTYSGNKITVEGISLDSFIKKHKLKTIDLVKMDVEGAEYEILLNTKSLSKINAIAMEFHDDMSHGHTYTELVRVLQKEGFKVHIPTPKWFIRAFKLGRLFAWKE